MPWLQLTFETTPEDADSFSDLLSETGANAVTFLDSADQPLYEPPVGETPLWSRTRIIGLFDAGTDMGAVLSQISAAITPNKLPDHRISPLEDKDWVREWMENFKPMSFGERLWIVPSWTPAPHPDAVNILLDPGLAFGTGTHPTTDLCLQWLDKHGAEHDAENKEVIDYGCGSGILAVAAAKLGAGHVWAVDNDPQALTATKDNADKNGVAEHITAVLPGALPHVQTPLLLANILAQPLMEFAERFSTLVIPGGHIVLSGILIDQAEQVTASYTPWFDMDEPKIKDEWVRLSGRRKE
ncbi:MAG: 50S ribosomal protein L11 methyltransferase [Ectothiorhodospiraceae bacterium]|nr:50S ribosomal protein L11 methyltransferase [Ectothiorhodospiraceae bacterium]